VSFRIFLVFLFFSQPLLAAHPTGPTQPERLPVNQFQSLIDLSGRLGAEDLDLIDFNNRPPDLSPPHLPGHSAQYWLKFDVTSKSEVPTQWFVVFDQPMDRSVTLYRLNNLGVFLQTTSLGQTPFAPDNKHPLRSHPLVSFTLAPHQSQSLLIQTAFDPTYTTNPPNVSLLSPKAWAEQEETARIIDGALWITCFLLFVFSLFSWLTWRDRGFLYYGWAVLWASLSYLLFSGRGLEFSPNWVWLKAHPLLWGQTAFVIGLVFFGLFLWRGIGLKWVYKNRDQTGWLLMVDLILLFGFAGVELFLDPDPMSLKVLVAASFLGLFGLMIRSQPGRLYFWPLGLWAFGWALAPTGKSEFIWVLPIAHFWVLGIYGYRLRQRRNQGTFDKIGVLAGESRLREEYAAHLQNQLNDRTGELLQFKLKYEEASARQTHLLNQFAQTLINPTDPGQQAHLFEDVLDQATFGRPLQHTDPLPFEPTLNRIALRLGALDLTLSNQSKRTFDLPGSGTISLVVRLCYEALELNRGNAPQIEVTCPEPGSLCIGASVNLPLETLQGLLSSSADLCQRGLGLLGRQCEALGGEIQACPRGEHSRLDCWLPVKETKNPPARVPASNQLCLVKSSSSLRQTVLILCLESLGFKARGVEALTDLDPSASWVVVDRLDPWNNQPDLDSFIDSNPTSLLCLQESAALSAFEFHALKAALTDPEVPAFQAPENAAPKAQLATRFPLEILVAEDDFSSRFYIKTLLNSQGYQPRIVNNGKLLLEALEQDPADVILLDLRMPVLNGLDAAKEIHRRFPGSSRPLLVALTSNAPEEDEDLFLSVGLDDFLTKPLTPEVFAKRAVQWSSRLSPKD